MKNDEMDMLTSWLDSEGIPYEKGYGGKHPFIRVRGIKWAVAASGKSSGRALKNALSRFKRRVNDG